MTVSTQIVKHVYDGNGVSIYWPYTFQFLESDTIAVYLVSPAGVVTKLASDFTIDTDNSRVIYPSVESGLDILPVDWKIVIARENPLTQELDLYRNSALDVESLEAAYDKAIMLLQELEEAVNRCVKYSIDKNPSESETTGILSDIEDLAEVAAEAVEAAEAAKTSETNAAASAASAVVSARTAQTAKDVILAMLDSALVMKNISTPTPPADQYNKLYFKNNRLYKMDSLGNEEQAGSGGGSSFDIVGKDENFTAEDRYTYLVDTSAIAISVQLPAPELDFAFEIKDIGFNSLRNNITLVRAANEKIDGIAQDKIFRSNGFCVKIISDGVDWFIV